MKLNVFLSELDNGETANFAIFGAKAFQQTLGNIKIDEARRQANIAAQKNSLVTLVVITPGWGGVQIPF